MPELLLALQHFHTSAKEGWTAKEATVP